MTCPDHARDPDSIAINGTALAGSHPARAHRQRLAIVGGDGGER
jgi:hypothetical protein